MSQVVGSILMLAGAVLTFIAGFGVVRLSSSLTRLHAAAKPASLGLGFVAVGAGITSNSAGLVATGLLVSVLQFLTAPVAGHLLGRTLGPAVDSVDVERPQVSPSKAWSKRWTLVLETTVVWLILWRDLSLANTLAGLGIGVGLALVIPPRASAGIRPLGAVAALSRYFASLMIANARMSYQVLFVSNERLRETITVCDLETREESVAFFDANATSFAPGTLTLEISPDVPYRMLVHAVGQTSEQVRSDVADLEASATRMFK